jgi:hypothetical protein
MVGVALRWWFRPVAGRLERYGNRLGNTSAACDHPSQGPALAPAEIGVEGGKPGPGRGHKTLDNVNPLQGGNSQSYLLRRIARDQPQLLDQIGPDKEFHSVRAAASENALS